MTLPTLNISIFIFIYPNELRFNLTAVILFLTSEFKFGIVHKNSDQ
ncbi:hypothetical protein VSPL_37120 [Vibrio splendidus]|nr:hypothetical protein VSPL_37120 [Vibrio splendidus]